jgi:hypothetical protein
LNGVQVVEGSNPFTPTIKPAVINNLQRAYFLPKSQNFQKIPLFTNIIPTKIRQIEKEARPLISGAFSCGLILAEVGQFFE